MKKFPIALQLFTVRDHFERDVAGTLEQVAQMGYDGVEFAGFFGVPADEMKAMLERVGLRAVCTHTSLERFQADLEGELDYAAALGMRYVALPAMPKDMHPGQPQQREGWDWIRRIGQAAKDKGLKLLYHNHNFEFVREADGSYALDAMYAAIPADILATELDCCWIKVAGEDPAAYVRKYADRCPIVHLKDIKSLEPFAFAEVGGGLQDIPSIIAAAEQSGAEWLVVEQDRWEMDSLDSARISRENLRKLGQ